MDGGRKCGEVQVGPTCTWAGFREACRGVVGREVGEVLYDDDFYTVKEKNIRCGTEEDWQDLLEMMREEAEHLHGRLALRLHGSARPA